MIAGIAVTALIVPKNLGYAGIAGIPLQNGLYAAAAGALLYALFCTSRQISTGPSSSLAAVAGGRRDRDRRRRPAAPSWSRRSRSSRGAVPPDGAVAPGLDRAVSVKAVITGFLAGAAIDVVIGELPKLTGTSTEGDSAWRELGSWLGRLAETHGTTVLVGLGALAVILGLRFVAPKVPGALVLVVGGLLASALLDLGSHGVALVGDVPSGLPSPALPAADVFAITPRRSRSPRRRCC